MKHPEIQHLYKYMSWNKYTKDSIEKGCFWFSSPNKFNDPIDCGISLNMSGNTPFIANLLATGFSDIGKTTGNSIRNHGSMDSIKDSIHQFVKSITDNATTISDEMNEAAKDSAALHHLRDKFSSSGILSLSELEDNVLMWSHYAQQHKGVCVELERNPTNILGSADYTLPVRYSIKAPIIDARLYRVAENIEQKEIEHSLILTKAADWTYEREWRVIKSGCADSLQSLSCRIESVTVGLRVDEDTQQQILELAKTQGFKVKKARLKPNEFGLKIEQIH